MTARRILDRIVRRAKLAGLDLSPSTLEGLGLYLSELSHWNSRINLTAFRLGDNPTDDAVDRLLVEPMLAAKYLPPAASDLIDIGSGGGSPAIPFKIARPDLRLTMVEVKVRKSAFLKQAIRRLSLQDSTVENLRVEELLSRPAFHGRFQVASVRAVRLEAPVWKALQSLLAPGGVVLHFTTMSAVQTPVPPFRPISTYPLLPTGSALAVSQKFELRRSGST